MIYLYLYLCGTLHFNDIIGLYTCTQPTPNTCCSERRVHLPVLAALLATNDAKVEASAGSSFPVKLARDLTNRPGPQKGNSPYPMVKAYG